MKPWAMTLAGVRYVVDPSKQELRRVIVADERRPFGPQSEADSKRLRAAELKRRRKNMQRMEAVGAHLLTVTYETGVHPLRGLAL